MRLVLRARTTCLRCFCASALTVVNAGLGFSTFRFPTSKAQHFMLSSCINTATAFFFLKVGWVFDVCVVCVFFFSCGKV